MFAKRVVPIVLVAQVIAGIALAQEYGRASGGQLELVAKQPTQLSGSLSLSRSRSLFGNSLNGLGGTLGGTIVPDRLWFFGSLERTDTPFFASTLPQIQAASAGSAKFDAHLGDRQSLTAIAVGSQFSSQTISPTMSAMPAWFGSVHYTGIISPNAFFTASVSQSVAH